MLLAMMMTPLMSPHLTQEMRDTLVSDAFLALPSPAQSATIAAYAQAIDLAAAAAQERESIKNKDDLREKLEKATLDALSAAHMEAHFRELYRECWDELQPLKKARLKLLERAVRAETERDLLKAHVRKIYDSRASNRAGPLQDPEAETRFAPALMPSSPVAAPAAEAASPKCQASEPPDGAGSPTYARLLATM